LKPSVPGLWWRC